MMESSNGMAVSRSIYNPRAPMQRSHPVLRRLSVSGAGFDRYAGSHLVERPTGAPHTIVCACLAVGAWVRIDEVSHACPVGAAFVLPAAVAHSYGCGDGPGTAWWWICVTGDDVPDLLAAMGATREDPIVPLRDPQRTAGLIEDAMVSLDAVSSPGGAIEAAGTAWKLLSQIAADRLRPERGAPLERAMWLIAERPERELTVADLAAAVGVSPSRLHALFRMATGGGVIAYQTGLRMAAARRLLDASDHTITEIAHRVGYTDPYYFSRRFRHEHGVSPTGFRRGARP
jgi:AraC family transcriptional regulator, arabinose operon regulatory protein